MLKVITKVVDITPSIPVYIGGHAMRKEKSKGVHDPIEAVVMWLEVDGVKNLFINADLSNFDYDFVHNFKRAVAAELGVKADLIVLSGNHTHSGPLLTTRNADQPHDEAYRNEVFEKLLTTAADIYGTEKEVSKVTFKTGESYGFYGNRNSKDKYGDQNIYVIEFKDDNDKTMEALVNISCHSTIMSPEEYLLSGDFLAALRRELIPVLGVVPIVTNGNAGDMSNRLYRQANDFNELHRVSSGVAKQISEFTTCYDLNLISEKYTSFAFHVEYDADVEGFKAKAEEFKLKLNDAKEYDDRKWLISEIAGFERKARTPHVSLTYETTIIRMNDLEIVVMPCELVSAFGKQIKKTSTAKACFVWGYANGQTGYVVEASEFNGGHDGISTTLPKGKAEEYVALVLQHMFD